MQHQYYYEAMNWIKLDMVFKKFEFKRSHNGHCSSGDLLCPFLRVLWQPPGIIEASWSPGTAFQTLATMLVDRVGKPVACKQKSLDVMHLVHLKLVFSWKRMNCFDFHTVTNYSLIKEPPSEFFLKVLTLWWYMLWLWWPCLSLPIILPMSSPFARVVPFSFFD